MNNLYFKDRYSGGTLRVGFRFGRYMADDSLYVGMDYFDEEHKEWEAYSVLTVCLSDQTLQNRRNCAFLNTNDEVSPDQVDWLVSNGFGKRTGYIGTSGFCVYPEFRFNSEAMRPYAIDDAEWRRWCAPPSEES